MEGNLYKKLFKLNTDGESIQVWELWHNDNSYWVISSRLDGKQIINEPTMIVPKVNRSMKEQLTLEMDAKVLEKTKKKYVENIKDVHKADSMLAGFSPMLAHKFNEQKGKLVYPVSIQPKLDGIRCVALSSGLFSRNREKFSSCKHIWNELQGFFKKYPDAILDGELFSMDYKSDFELITKAVRKTEEKATPEDIKLQEKIEYHIYDAPRIAGKIEKDSFVERFTIVCDLLKGYKNIVLVETLHNISMEEQIIAHKERYTEMGYEGIMIRQTFNPYEQKRSYGLLKLKDFIDDEFLIVGVEEGEGNYRGHAASFVLEIDGKQFNAKMKGKKERLKYIFQHQSEVIGKMATIRYQNLTSAGIPRFPVCFGVRGLKDRSDWL